MANLKGGSTVGGKLILSSEDTYLKVDGSRAMTGDLDLSGKAGGGNIISLGKANIADNGDNEGYMGPGDAWGLHHPETAQGGYDAVEITIDDQFLIRYGSTTRLTLSTAGQFALTNGTSINEFSTDGTLTGNSDDAVPTEKAVKTYADAQPPKTHSASHTDGSDDIRSATTSVDGIVQLATAATTSAGTSAARGVTPDGLAGSVFGERSVCIPIFDADTVVTTGDGIIAFCVPFSLNGFNLVDVCANVYGVSSAGTIDVQVRRRRAATNADMLSTKVTIAASAYFAYDGVVNGANDDLNTGDKIYIDVDAAGTGADGLSVTLTFRKP
jgi:hypothetical protein